MPNHVVAAFTKIHEAYFARIQLEIEGIDSSIFDEYFIGVHPLYSAAIGGVKLAVNESDMKEAKVILEKYLEDQHAIFETNMHMCPNCHSTNIRSATATHIIIALILMFLTGFLWLVLYKKRKCYECGHRQAW